MGIGGHFGSFTYGSQTPAISLQYEKGMWDIGGPGVISLGGYVGRKGYKYSGSSGSYHYSEKWNYTVIGVRSAYHYNGINNEKFDVYGSQCCRTTFSAISSPTTAAVRLPIAAAAMAARLAFRLM